jgi:hypothetical protein
MSVLQREDKTSFYPILETLLKSVPGAYSAIFCDDEGESIEFCGPMSPYDIKIAGAYSTVIIQQLRRTGPRTIAISCSNLTMTIHEIKGYTLTLILERRTFSAALESAIEKAAEKFIREADLK